MKLWHRLRGHKLRRFARHVTLTSTGPGAVERGRVDYGTLCSCGRTWFDQ